MGNYIYSSVFYKDSVPPHENIPLMAVEYLNRESDGVFTAIDGYTRIGDTIIGGNFTDGSASVVDQISVSQSYTSTSIPTLRGSISSKTNASQSPQTFEIVMTFFGAYAITGSDNPAKNVVTEPGLKNAPHPNSIAALVAQFKLFPIVPVEDWFLNVVHGVDTVALQSMEIFTTKTFPGAIKVKLTVVAVDYSLYSPQSSKMISAVIWPIYRWHWRRYYQFLGPGTVIIPTAIDVDPKTKEFTVDETPANYITGDLNGAIDFYLADERLLAERKSYLMDLTLAASEEGASGASDGGKGNISKPHIKSLSADEIPYNLLLSIGNGNNEDIVATTIHVTLTNRFAFHKPEEADGYYVQFMGHGDSYVSLILTAFDTGVPKLTGLIQVANRLCSEYRVVARNSPLIILNEIINLAGVRAVMPRSSNVSTVPGSPGLCQVAMDFVEFDINQKKRGEAHRLFGVAKGKEFFDFMKGIDGYRITPGAENFYKDFTKYLRQSTKSYILKRERPRTVNGAIARSQLHPWYGCSYIEIAMDSLTNTEVYPDLQLPTYERLIFALESTIADIKEYDDITVGDTQRYIDAMDTEDAEILHNILTHYRILDEYLWGKGRYPDPDFWIDYPRKLQSRDDVDDLFADINGDNLYTKIRDALDKYSEQIKNSAILHSGKKITEENARDFAERIEKNVLALKWAIPFFQIKPVVGDPYFMGLPNTGNGVWNNGDFAEWYAYRSLYERLANDASLKESEIVVSEEAAKSYAEFLLTNETELARCRKEMIEIANAWDAHLNGTGTPEYGIWGHYEICIKGWQNKPISEVLSGVNLFLDFEKDRFSPPYVTKPIEYLVFTKAIDTPRTEDDVSKLVDYYANKVIAKEIGNYLAKRAAYTVILGTVNEELLAEFHRDKGDKDLELEFLCAGSSPQDRDYQYYGGVTSIAESTIISSGTESKDGPKPFCFKYSKTPMTSTKDAAKEPTAEGEDGIQIDPKGYDSLVTKMSSKEIFIVDRDASGVPYSGTFQLPSDGNVGRIAGKQAMFMNDPEIRKRIEAIKEDAARKSSSTPLEQIGFYKTFMNSAMEKVGSAIYPRALHAIITQMDTDLSSKKFPSKDFIKNAEVRWTHLKLAWTTKKYNTDKGKVSLRDLWKAGTVSPASEAEMKTLLDAYCCIRKLPRDVCKAHGGENEVLGATLAQALGKVDVTYRAEDIKDIYTGRTDHTLRGADTFQDQLLRPEGRLLHAFPGFAIQIAEEGPNIKWRKFLPIYWDVSSISRIQIENLEDSPMQYCSIVLANPFRNYTNIGVLEEMRDNMPQKYRFKPFLEDGNIKWNSIWENMQITFTGWMFDLGLTDIASWAFAMEHETDIIVERLRAYSALMLKQDMRLHVRIGYGGNARMYPVAFNGTITGISGGDLVEVFADGDGNELINKINKGYDSNDVVSNDISQPEPRETILAMLNAHHESYFINGIGDRLGRAWYNLAFVATAGHWYGERGLGIVHYGCPILHRLNAAKTHSDPDYKLEGYLFPQSEDATVSSTIQHEGMSIPVQNLLAGSVGVLSAAAGLPWAGIPMAMLISSRDRTQGCLGFGSPGETGENIYSSFSAVEGYNRYASIKNGMVRGEAAPMNLPDISKWHTNKVLGWLHCPYSRLGCNMKVAKKSPWDIIQTFARVFPPYIAASRPFEYRSTLFFGAPYYTFRYNYIRVGTGAYGKDTYGEPQKSETSKPIQLTITVDWCEITYSFNTKSEYISWVFKTWKTYNNVGGDPLKITIRDILYGVTPEGFATQFKEHYDPVLAGMYGGWWEAYQNALDSCLCSLSGDFIDEKFLMSLSAKIKNTVYDLAEKIKAESSGDPDAFNSQTEEESDLELQSKVGNGTVGMPISYLCKPFNQMFVNTTMTDILHNGMVCSSDEISTEVILTFWPHSKAKGRSKPIKCYLDKHIYPQLRKTRFEDSDLVGLSGFSRGLADVIIFSRYLGGGIKNTWADLNGYVRSNPDHMEKYTVKGHAMRYARSILRDDVKKMYGGTIVIRGCERIFPHCMSYIYDGNRGIVGPANIGGVSHIFDANSGFVTAYTPRLIAAVKGDTYGDHITQICAYFASAAVSYVVSRWGLKVAYAIYKYALNLLLTRSRDLILSAAPGAVESVASAQAWLTKNVTFRNTAKLLSNILKKIGTKSVDLVGRGIAKTALANELLGTVAADVSSTIQASGTEAIAECVTKSIADNIGSTRLIQEKILYKTAGDYIIKHADDIALQISDDIAGVAAKDLTDDVITGIVKKSVGKVLLNNIGEGIANFSTATWTKICLGGNIFLLIASIIIGDYITNWWDNYIDSFYSLTLHPMYRKGKPMLSGVSGFKNLVIVKPSSAVGAMTNAIEEAQKNTDLDKLADRLSTSPVGQSGTYFTNQTELFQPGIQGVSQKEVKSPTTKPTTTGGSSS